MKVEYSEQDGKKPLKKRKRSKRKAKIRAVCIFVVAILVVLTALSLTVFFDIEKIVVSGSSIYTQEEILAAASVNDGDNLILLSAGEIEEHLEKVLPYIKKAEVSRHFPSTLAIEVVPCEEKYMLINEQGNYITDDSFKVLRRFEKPSNDFIRIKGISTESMFLGEKATFTNKEQRDVLNELMSLCADKGINIRYVDVSSLVDIGFLINDRVYVKLGSYLDINYKLEHLSAMLKDFDENASCSVSLSGWSVDNKNAVLKYEDIAKYME